MSTGAGGKRLLFSPEASAQHAIFFVINRLQYAYTAARLMP
jgi:hypothetical protein